MYHNNIFFSVLNYWVVLSIYENIILYSKKLLEASDASVQAKERLDGEKFMLAFQKSWLSSLNNFYEYIAITKCDNIQTALFPTVFTAVQHITHWY